MALVRYPTTKPLPFSGRRSGERFSFPFWSGGDEPEGQPQYGTVTEQVNAIMRSVSETLARGGAQLSNVVRAQVWAERYGAFC